MKVTVVTPTWNARTHLRDCIESARAQQCADVEVEHIIVDAGSEDGTIELARSYGLDVRVGKDRGIFDAINKGSFNSTGELLGFLGADDTLLPGGLKQIVDAYRAGGRPWVVGGIAWTGAGGESRGYLAAPPTWMNPSVHASLGWNCIMHMATYVSRPFFTELGGFNIDYRVSGDYDFFSRALKASPYTRVASPIACFRRTGVNFSAVSLERARVEYDTLATREAPSSPLQRRVSKLALQVWLNGRNPGWAFRKWALPSGAVLR